MYVHVCVYIYIATVYKLRSYLQASERERTPRSKTREREEWLSRANYFLLSPRDERERRREDGGRGDGRIVGFRAASAWIGPSPESITICSRNHRRFP